MTVSSTTRKAGPFTGNGVTTAFPFTFKVFAKTDLQVTKTTTATGAQSVLVLDSDYSVTLNADQDTTPGGTITYPLAGSPLAATETLAAIDVSSMTQESDIGNAGSFLPQVIEDALDRLTIFAQRLLELAGRALSLPVGESGGTTLPARDLRKNKSLIFDDNGDAAVAATSADVQLQVDQALGYKNDAADSATLAQQWAAQMATTVDGVDFSAKYYAMLADAAQINASTSASSALAAQRIFATTAAGIAGTSNGQYFYVISAASTTTLELWLNNAGVANDTGKRFPSLSAVANLLATAVSGVEFAVQDSNDNASEYIEPSTGKRYLNAIDANSVNGIPRYRLNKATRSAPNLKASIVHHISYGQSLSLGNGSGVSSLPTVDSGFFDCLMFNANGTAYAGPRAQEGTGTVAQNHASFVAYEERPITGSTPTGNGETPLGNALRMVKRLLRDEDGINPADYEYQILGSAPGQSNTAIAGLAKGQVPYTNLINDVTYGLALSAAGGKSYCVNVVYWSQGERDIQLNTNRTTYKNALLQLYTDLNTDIKALTGQTHDIKLIAYQVTESDQFTFGNTSPDIALAQLDAAKANSNIILATCVYAFEHLAGGNAHLTGRGYAHMGAYYGLAAKRTVVDGASWANLYPTRLTRNPGGKIVDVEFADTGYPIALSATLFPLQTNYGFTAVSAGNVDNPIVSVTKIGPRSLRIVLTNALAGNLRYGFNSWGGNLHDTCDIDPGTATDYVLYRPCLTFEEPFA